MVANIEDAHSDAATRRTPAQQRSRDRLEKILSVATALISAKGSDQVKMSEVAEQAGISIGSLYQYFPDKASIIRTLAQRYSAESRACIEAALRPVNDLEGLKAAYLGLIDTYYDVVLADPAQRDVWSGMQADTQLRDLELADSRASGELLTAAMTRVHDGLDPARVATSAFLVWQLGEATMRLALSCPPDEGRALVEAFKRMSVREILEP